MVQRRSVLAVLLVVCAGGAGAGAAQAAPAWLDPVGPLSAAGQTATDPAVAIDGAGNVLALWSRNDGSVNRIEATFRPGGGAFAESAPISEAGQSAAVSDVAFDPAGNAIAVWVRSDGTTMRAQAAFRPAGGTFQPATTISPAGRSAAFPQVAFDGQGNALAAWSDETGMRAAYRPAGQDFGAAATISAAGTLSNQFDLLFDAAGNGLVAWPRKPSSDPNLADARVELAVKPAGQDFQPAVPVSGLHKNVGTVRAAVEPGGGVQVAYVAFNGSRFRVEVARRAPGNAFDTPQDVTATSGTSTATQSPDIAIDAAGNAVAIWVEGFQVWVASRAGAAPFAPAVRISPDSGNVYFASIRFDAAGDAVAVWPEQWADATGSGTLGYFITSMIRRAGTATFGERRAISTNLGGNGLSSAYDVAMDGAGNGVAVWEQTDGSKDRVRAAGYDAAPPRLRTTSFPGAGTPGGTLSFGADAVDVWSPFTLTWDFGDGASATGTPASHSYAVPGTFAPRVTATDSLGNAATATGSVVIAAAGGGPQPPDGSDNVAPVLSALKLAPSRFRAAASGASVAVTRVGTVVTYRLTEAAKVRFTVQRATSGRRVGASCRRVTRQNRSRKPCTRYVAVKGSFTHAGRVGANRLTFRGRVGGRKLAVGQFRLNAQATDDAPNKSALRRVAFRIVRR